MRSINELHKIIDHLRMIIFPGYFGADDLKPDTMKYYTGAALDELSRLLAEQIKRGFCFSCAEGDDANCVLCEKKADEITLSLLNALPKIRSFLCSDIRAAYVGDPAAKSTGETIFCYPSIKALTNYRVAHELYKLEVPLIPRILTEIAHSETGIDIHPGATIDECFFMDHGTGIVIGETTIIGKNVRVYQGVTLGAKSFPLDENGRLIKGIARHPIIEDDVIIYSGATLLGRIKIGKGAVIGGNVWLIHDVEAGNKILQSAAEEMHFVEGAGI